MPVDPELQVVVDLVNSMGETSPWELGVEGMRASMDGLGLLFGEARQDVVVDDIHVAGRGGPIPVRRYVPDGGGSGAALIWFHGGGWVIGSLDSHDVLCRDLAATTGTTVLSVGYRLAPEHPYPAAVEDAVDATVAIAAGAAGPAIDTSRIAVGGDSAGGHLATVVARQLRDLGGPSLRCQVLIYPVTDQATGSEAYPSLTANATGYILTAATMDFFTECFVPDPARREEPDASPIRAEDLSGLPPALVITAEYDPLRDEGEAYASAMARAGVDVVAERHDGTVHLFFQLSTTGPYRRARDQVASFLGDRL